MATEAKQNKESVSKLIATIGVYAFFAASIVGYIIELLAIVKADTTADFNMVCNLVCSGLSILFGLFFIIYGYKIKGNKILKYSFMLTAITYSVQQYNFCQMKPSYLIFSIFAVIGIVYCGARLSKFEETRIVLIGLIVYSFLLLGGESLSAVINLGTEIYPEVPLPDGFTYYLAQAVPLAILLCLSLSYFLRHDKYIEHEDNK